MEFQDLGPEEEVRLPIVDTWGPPDMGDDENYDEDYDDNNDYDGGNTIEEPVRDFEESRKRARGLIISATDRTLSTWFMSDQKRIVARQDYACHAELVEFIEGMDDMEVFASCFNTKSTLKHSRSAGPGLLTQDATNEIAERYWDFVAGPESPWGLLFKRSLPEKIVDNDGILMGFFLDPRAVVEYRSLTLNFCIAMRMIGEEVDTISMWYDLVDRGVDKADALYLARMVRWASEIDMLGRVTVRSDNDSCHWPLLAQRWSEMSFDFERFRDGRPNLVLYPETHYWLSSPYREDFNIYKIDGDRKVDRSCRPYFKIEDVISAFESFVSAKSEKEREVA